MSGEMGDIAQREGEQCCSSATTCKPTTLCDRAVLLRDGRTHLIGNVADAVTAYPSWRQGRTAPAVGRSDGAPGNDIVRVRHQHPASTGDASSAVALDTPLTLAIEYWRLVPDRDVLLDVVVYASEGSAAFETMSIETEPGGLRGRGLFRTTCEIPAHLLNEGTYRVRVQFVDESSRPVFNMPDALTVMVHDTAVREVAWFGRFHGSLHPSGGGPGFA